MRIGTTNKLAHLQCEYRELTERTQMLQNQLTPLNAQVVHLYNYLASNQGDRAALAEYKRARRSLSTMSNTIQRNIHRLCTLERQIYNENARLLRSVNGY